MKKLLKKIAHCNLLIDENENAIVTAPQLPFYKLYGRDGELEQDVAEFKERLKEQLDEKFMLLENLQIEIEKQKAAISYKKRELNCQNNQMPIAS